MLADSEQLSLTFDPIEASKHGKKKPKPKPKKLVRVRVCRDCGVQLVVGTNWLASAEKACHYKCDKHRRKQNRDSKSHQPEVLAERRLKLLADNRCPHHPGRTINADSYCCAGCACSMRWMDIRLNKKGNRAPIHPDIAHLSDSELARMTIENVAVPGGGTGWDEWERFEQAGLLTRMIQFSREVKADNGGTLVDFFDMARTEKIPYDPRPGSCTIVMRTQQEQTDMRDRHGLPLGADPEYKRMVELGAEMGLLHGT